MDFGEAIKVLKSGKRVSRAGWNGKGMWLSYSPGSPALPAANFWSPCNKAFAEQNGGVAEVLPCITMKTADGKVLMGWLASQTDMLSEDWGRCLGLSCHITPADLRAVCHSLDNEHGSGGQTMLARLLCWHYLTLWRKLNGLSKITRSDELAIRQAVATLHTFSGPDSDTQTT